VALDEATPLIGAMQDIAKKSKKGGYPRAENGSEFMTERASDRAKGKGQHVQNELFHGHPTDSRTTIGKGRIGKYGMTV